MELSVPEVRRLLHALSESEELQKRRLHWSRFRRQHQARARRFHRLRRARQAQGCQQTRRLLCPYWEFLRSPTSTGNTSARSCRHRSHRRAVQPSIIA